MELKTVKDAFEHVTKKRKLSSFNCHDVIDQIGHQIEAALVKLQSVNTSITSPDHMITIVGDLKTKLKEINSLIQLETSQKELNAALSKYQKQLDKSFDPDISKSYRKADFDVPTMNQVVASYLYREGLFDEGDCFCNESGEKQASAMKTPFVEMYLILQAMKSHDVEPALRWINVNQVKLGQNGSDLQFKLHRLQYIDILQKKQDKDEALRYARTFLFPFSSTHTHEFHKLMACLLWVGKLDSSPYTDLLSPTNWEKLSEEFTRLFCNLLGQSSESPLSVTVAAGVEALPGLLKLMNVMTRKKLEWESMEQIPVPIELSKEFQFHSVFVCPVSRDQASEENPPMLMPCGHVLCKESIVKLSKSISTNSFKCPYCPVLVYANQCMQLFF